MQNSNKKRKNHTSHRTLHTSQNGITLIALIITIIVMLILVGVTVNVALNGGLFSKAEEATTKTKIAQIQEALMLKKAEVLAEYDGKAPEDYRITMNGLNLPTELTTQYGSKLVISKDAKLYYDSSVVTNEAEQNLFKSMGIQEYTENDVPEFYGFGYIVDMGNNEVFKYYFLENGIALMNYDKGDGTGYGTTRYTRTEAGVSVGATNMVLSEDFKTLSNTNMTMERNESYIYKYNPVQNQTYKIYSNAFYTSETTDNIILTFEETIQYDDYFSNDYPFSDMETDGAVVSEDGTQITYQGNVYTLVE